VYAATHAAEHPDEPAFIMATTGETISFGEHEARSNRVAHLLRDLGLKRLDHVAIFMENNPRMFEFEAGAERTGLYFTCINSYLAPAEAAYIVNDCRARVVVSSAALAPVAKELPALCPDVERWLMVDSDNPGDPWESYEAVTAKYPAAWPVRLAIETNSGIERAGSDYPKGNAENPVSTEELERKFAALVSSRFGKASADAMLSALHGIDRCPDMADLFAPALVA
jgi:acyl-CoA synthetase (AMP-forming)/AMP-acid ligase II